MKLNLTRKVWSVFFILGVAALAEMMNNIILGRSLPASVFGEFKFINTVALTLSSLLLFGQNMAIIRIFGKEKLERYNWRGFIDSCLKFTIIVAALICFALAYYYKMKIELLYAYIAVIAGVGIEYHSALMRAKERYAYSMFLTKTSSIVFFILLIFVVCLYKNNSLNTLLIAYSSIFVITWAISSLSVKKLPLGKEPVPGKVVKEGLWLFMISFSFMIMIQIDKFFIAKMLGYEKLADYVVVITITRGFDLIAMALWFVLMPHYAIDLTRSIKKDTVKVTVAAGVVCAGYALFGKTLLHLFFGGKYDASAYLLVFFIIIGFLRVMYSIPSGIIGGRLPEKYLRLFLSTCVIGIFINVAGNYFLIPIYGLRGAAISTMSSWIFRVISAYFVVYKQSSGTHISTAESVPA